MLVTNTSFGSNGVLTMVSAILTRSCDVDSKDLYVIAIGSFLGSSQLILW